MLHDEYSYDPYIDDNNSQDDHHLHSVDSPEIHIPAPWIHSKSDIAELWCTSVNSSHRYYYTTIGRSDGKGTLEIGCVEGRDFRDLIQPDMISSNLMDHIFY
jgi:hypothetical protein